MVLIIRSQLLIQTALYVVDRLCCAVQVAVVFCVMGTETLDNINVAVAACIENRRIIVSDGYCTWCSSGGGFGNRTWEGAGCGGGHLDGAYVQTSVGAQSMQSNLGFCCSLWDGLSNSSKRSRVWSMYRRYKDPRNEVVCEEKGRARRKGVREMVVEWFEWCEDPSNAVDFISRNCLSSWTSVFMYKSRYTWSSWELEDSYGMKFKIMEVRLTFEEQKEKVKQMPNLTFTRSRGEIDPIRKNIDLCLDMVAQRANWHLEQAPS